MAKVINLKNVCPDEITKLERHHYETTTNERILGVALATAGQTSSVAIDTFYDAYYVSYVAYERAKQEFFDKYIATHVEDPHSSWEINFVTGDLTLYD